METDQGYTSGYTTQNSSQYPSQTAIDIDPSKAVEEDIEQWLEEEEEAQNQEEVVTGVTKKKRIVLTKRTYLLVAFVLITGLAIAANYVARKKLIDHDIPPTAHSSESFTNTLYALYAITIVAPAGFLILKLRVTNISIGFIYMFFLVLCIFFSAKAISRGLFCIVEDTESNIRHFVLSQDTDLTDSELNKFWHYFQKELKCCGTKEIDRVEDWPYYLNSTHLPYSCCSDEYIKILKDRYRNEFSEEVIATNCGIGLGRTYTKGWHNIAAKTKKKVNIFKRIPSGFFLSLTGLQKKKMIEYRAYQSKIEFHPEDYYVTQLDVKSKEPLEYLAPIAFTKTWKIYYVDSVWNKIAARWIVDEIRSGSGADPKPNITAITELWEKEKINVQKNANLSLNDIVSPANLDHEEVAKTVGVVSPKGIGTIRNRCLDGAGYIKDKNKNSRSDWCKKRYHKNRPPANTLGRELLLRLDYLTSYIYELASKEQEATAVAESDQWSQGTWILWDIPTEFDEKDTMHPYKLAANLFRVRDIHDKEQRKMHTKKMYYMSRGISENYVLKGKIHPKICEGLTPEFYQNIKEKVARELNKRWRYYGPVAEWRNPKEGLGEWFLSHVQEVAYACIVVSSLVILSVVIIAIIFWQYYSRIKAEEYANLALPKEFEVLHLRRGSMLDDADIDIKLKHRPKKNQVGAPPPRYYAPAPQIRRGIGQARGRGRGRGGGGKHHMAGPGTKR